MTKTVIHAIQKKPDDQAEWQNVMQLMYHLRQAIGCTICGKLVKNPYTPVQEPCHCICSNCCNGNVQLLHNCSTCKNALRAGDGAGFETNSDLNHTAIGFVDLCKLIVDMELVDKWSSLQVITPNGPITFGQLIREGCNSTAGTSTQNLGDLFRKKVKEKEHHCRCGSGNKKGDGRATGNLTCLGQRCTCYREGKGCVKCKCIGCKNPNGMSESHEFS